MRRKTGELAESIACEHLVRSGYHILARNYHTRYAEIDIVAFKKNMLVFVEVRSKHSEIHGTPEETINQRKMARVLRAGLVYIAFNPQFKRYRVDAVCIVFAGDESVRRLDHYENITS